jgi:hypothetical protein
MMNFSFFRSRFTSRSICQRLYSIGMGCLWLDLSGLERGYDQISEVVGSHGLGLVFGSYGLDS